MSVLVGYSQVAPLRLMVIGKLMVYLGISAIMLCIPVLNKAFWLGVILVFMSGTWIQNWKVLLKDKVFITGLVLLLLLSISLFYSYASINFSLRAWNKYLKILYPLFFLPFFTHERSRTEAVSLFLVSVMISEALTYLHYFNVVNFGFSAAKHWLFVQDLDAGYIVSFACYLLANLVIDGKKYRWLYLSCFLICSFDLLFLNVERTGYLIYLGLAGLFFLQRFKWRGFLFALVAIPILFASLYIGTATFQNRINQVVSNLSDYQNGNQVTSIGLRLIFAKYSFKILENNWLTGTGVGSFEENYRALKGPKLNDWTWPAHPHDEYINILLQTGIIGFTTFLLWIFFQLQTSFSLPLREKNSLQALIVGFLLLSFCNASLLVNPAGACYVVFLGIFLAAKYESDKELQ